MTNYGVYYWKTTPHNLHICWNNSSPLSPLSCTGALILQVGPRSSPHSSVDDCIIHASLSNDLSSAIEERGLSIIPDSLEKNGHSRDQCLSMAEYIYKPNHEHLRVHNFFVKLRIWLFRCLVFRFKIWNLEKITLQLEFKVNFNREKCLIFEQNLFLWKI